MVLKTRGILDKKLMALNEKIIKMGSLIDEAIEKAMNSLYERDVSAAAEVVAGDEVINDLRYEIEDEAQLIVATQQPAVGDLRQVIAAIHIAVELERIGDHAARIASVVERMENEEEFDTLHKLPKMAKRARTMVQTAVEAFVTRDAELAFAMIGKDDKIDRQYRKLINETLGAMRDDDYIRRGTFLIWLGNDLERIGDRATNICERVIFMDTGKHIEIMSDDVL